MNSEAAYINAIQRELANPQQGVIGLVDLMVRLCSEFELEIDWSVDRLSVRSRSCDWQPIEGTLPRRSIFRAVLARIATISHDDSQQAVSPYGGEGTIDSAPSGVSVHASFVNTTDEQRLWMSALREKNVTTGAVREDFEAPKVKR